MNQKWTNGLPFVRSRRLKHVQDMEIKDVENNAYSSALYHDENTWDLLNILVNKPTTSSSFTDKQTTQ
jgi:hypothetical protein